VPARSRRVPHHQPRFSRAPRSDARTERQLTDVRSRGKAESGPGRMKALFPSHIRAVTLMTAFLASACDSGDALDCSAPVDLACTPAYEPTFAMLHERTFKVSCALSGGQCHSAAGRQRGVNLETVDDAYASLQKNDRVVPGRPECSKVVHRIQSSDRRFQMPPGLPLDAAERCAIVLWIRDGGLR
jgi:hypothetical protein